MTEAEKKDESFWETLKENSEAAKERYLGPSYNYVENIKLPSEIGMGPGGSLRQFGKDIEGLVAYTELLVSGGGAASKPKGPMGNKFFLQTGAQCMVSADENGNAIASPYEDDRYIYINNIPSGNIPFISAGVGANFTSFRGLVPGTLEQMNNFNPISMLTSLVAGLTPPCQPITMEVVDVHNNKSKETHFVTYADIDNMDPCWFSIKKNPRTGKICRETFSNMGSNNWTPVIPKDTKTQIYFASLGVLGIYIAYKGMQKMDLIPK